MSDIFFRSLKALELKELLILYGYGQSQSYFTIQYIQEKLRKEKSTALL